MTMKTYIPVMEAYLDREITTLKREMGVITGVEVPLGLSDSEGTGHRSHDLSKPSSQNSAVEKLDQQLARLEQIREWLAQDHNLRNLVDAAIAMQVGASERRQRWLSILLTVVSLLVGSLLSLLATPATLTDLLKHVL